jgi:L-asparaginase
MHVNSPVRSGTLPCCVLLSTGGTIASRIAPETGLAVPALSAKDLVSALPELEGRIDVRFEDFCRVPSPHIEPAHWAAMAGRVKELLADPTISGVVISHGTGLLEETAWFLDVVLDSEKPVVLVGAQRNSSERDYDGTRNLLDALRTCASPDARGRGVLVVMNQHINAAREVSKMHTFDVETFASGEWGYLGNVTARGVEFQRSPLRRTHLPYAGQHLPRVDVVSMYSGATGALLKAAVEDGAAGLVVQAVGSGHLNPAMAQAATQLMRKGVPVVVATRVPRGGTRACYGFEGSSQMLADEGAVLAGGLSAWKARVLLMIALAGGITRPPDLQALFEV